jgi:hypothetical protein
VLAAIGLAAVVVIGGGVFAFAHFAPQSWRNQAAALVKSSASGRPSSAASPAVKLTTQPLSPVDADGPPGDPFSGTPADRWADGAAGITIPAARARLYPPRLFPAPVPGPAGFRGAAGSLRHRYPVGRTRRELPDGNRHVKARYGATGSPASQAAPRSYSRSVSGPRTPGMSGLTG